MASGEEKKPDVTKKFLCGAIEFTTIKRGSFNYRPNGKGFGFVRLQHEDEKLSGMCACIDGNDSMYYRSIEGEIEFSPNGDRYAYAARGQRYFLVVDGTEHISNGPPVEIVFSPDSSRVASVFRHDRNSLSVFEEASGGDSGESFEKIDRLGYSADSMHYAYFGLRGDEWSFVYDGKVIENKGITATADGYALAGKSFAFKGVSKTGHVMVYNKMVYGKYDSTSLPVLSADGKRLAFTAVPVKGENLLVLDGKEILIPDCKVSELVFSPDGTKLAYIRTTAEGDVVLIGDDEEKTTYKKCSNLLFSDDGKHFAYCAQLADGKQCVVLDSAAGTQYRKIEDGFSFAPKSGKVCYMCDGRRVFVFGDKSYEMPTNAARYIAGPSGKHFVILVAGTRETGSSCLIDGTEKRENVQWMKGLGVAFQDESTVNYILFEEEAYFVVTERIGE